MSQADFLDSVRCLAVLAGLLLLFWLFEKVSG